MQTVKCSLTYSYELYGAENPRIFGDAQDRAFCFVFILSVFKSQIKRFGDFVNIHLL